jgi:hypothetical protein
MNVTTAWIPYTELSLLFPSQTESDNNFSGKIINVDRTSSTQYF